MSSSLPLSRRHALALGGLAAAGTLVPALPAVAASQSPRAAVQPQAREGVLAARGFLRRMTDAYPQAGNPTLPQSYADELGLFSTAFVYDAALAVCAALAVGDFRLARTIGDGLVFAQANDPTHADGRLRQGYNVGPYTFYDGTPNPHGLRLPDGTANIGWQFGFLGTAVGDMAWPGIALVRLYATTGDARYRDAARRIATWIVENATNERALGGFTFGVNGGNERQTNASTEHNIDCVAFFTLLQRIDKQGDWASQAERARAFVDQMWSGQYFYTGTNDGATVNTAVLPLDPQTWSWLTLLEPRYVDALGWATDALGTTDSPEQEHSQLPDGLSLSGVTFSDASLRSTASYNGIQVNPHGVWFEGSAQLALATRTRAGKRHRQTSRTLLDNLRVAQTSLGLGQHVGGQPVSGGVVAASSVIDSGFGFGYFGVQHVGATAWYAMAEQGYNPMRF